MNFYKVLLTFTSTGYCQTSSKQNEGHFVYLDILSDYTLDLSFLSYHYSSAWRFFPLMLGVMLESSQAEKSFL